MTPRFRKDGTQHYLLVCGEGRLKAFFAIGEAKIPAMVVDVTNEDAFIMSLAENIARPLSPIGVDGGYRTVARKGL